MVELGVGRFGRLGVGWLSWVLSGWAVGCSVFELGVGRLGGWAVGRLGVRCLSLVLGGWAVGRLGGLGGLGVGLGGWAVG